MSRIFLLGLWNAIAVAYPPRKKTSSETQINVDKSTGYSRREGDDYTMEKIKDIFLNIKDAI